MEDYTQYNIVVKKYKFIKDIGIGSFTKVIKAQCIDTQKLVAIKLYSREKLNDPEKKKLVDNEIYILKNLPQNEYVTKLLETFWEDDFFYVVFEYCQGGDLQCQLNQRNFTENEAIKIFRNIVAGVAFLHQNRFIHRDLKPENIFIQNKLIKIGDFGFAQKISHGHCILGQYGTPVYMAPEVLKNEPYNLKADVWSLGCLFYELLFKQLPYYEKSVKNLLNSMKTKHIKSSIDQLKISNFSKDILKQCLELNHSKRIDSQTLKNKLKDFKLQQQPINVTLEVKSLSQCSLKQDLTNILNKKNQIPEIYIQYNMIIQYCSLIQKQLDGLQKYLKPEKYCDFCQYRDRLFQIFAQQQNDILQQNTKLKNLQQLYSSQYLLNKSIQYKNLKFSKEVCKNQLLKTANYLIEDYLPNNILDDHSIKQILILVNKLYTLIIIERDTQKYCTDLYNDNLQKYMQILENSNLEELIEFTEYKAEIVEIIFKENRKNQYKFQHKKLIVYIQQINNQHGFFKET